MGDGDRTRDEIARMLDRRFVALSEQIDAALEAVLRDVAYAPDPPPFLAVVWGQRPVTTTPAAQVAFELLTRPVRCATRADYDRELDACRRVLEAAGCALVLAVEMRAEGAWLFPSGRDG